MKNIFKYSILASMLMLGVSAHGSVIQTVKEMLEFSQTKEDCENALKMLQEELKLKQKPNTVKDLKFWAGKCCFYLERYDEATTYFEASAGRHSESYLYLGRIGFATYDFEMASGAYEDYEEALAKSKKQLPEDVEAEVKKVNTAQPMLDRVESIVVIDSIDVPKEKFFTHYRLALSSGRLRPLEELPVKTSDGGVEQMYYTNENDDFILWADVDSALNIRLHEASRLNDGTWHEPMIIDFGEEWTGDCAYPFMMSDGATMYFANNGEESIGGYDIFRSNRDVETHEYMSPQNMGMPYNSPYNDYMLAIDEENGVGWWATDRNSPSDGINEGQVTIYVFIPNTVRTNRNIDDPNIVDYALVNDFKKTWEEDADYTEILQTISQIDVNKKVVQAEFEFTISSGVVYRNYEDFKSDEGIELMREYVDKSAKFALKMEELSDLRLEYKNGATTSLESEIKRYESMVQDLHKEILYIKNRIYKVEK